MNPGDDTRRARVAAIRKKFDERDRRELERVKQKLRDRHPLLPEESDLVLRFLGAARREAGAPALLTVPHQWLARHFWWLYEEGERNVAKTIAREWNLSVAAVRKLKEQHKDVAMDFVRKTQSVCTANPELRPKQAVTRMLDDIAQEFRRLAQ